MDNIDTMDGMDSLDSTSRKSPPRTETRQPPQPASGCNPPDSTLTMECPKTTRHAVFADEKTPFQIAVEAQKSCNRRMQIHFPPVRWYEILLALGRLAKSLERRALPPFCWRLADDPHALHRQLSEAEQTGRAAVNQLATRLARGEPLPTGLSPEETLFLRLRLLCAAELLDMAFPSQFRPSPFGEVPETWSHAQAMEWLLIDLWEHRCAERLKLDALTLAERLSIAEASPAATDARPA